MPVQSLNLAMNELRGYAGDYLGWGRGPTYGEEAWSDRKLSLIDQFVSTGLRMVYFQASVDGRAPHQWSWLTPACEVVLSEGERYANLPTDFLGFADHYCVVTLAESGTGGVFSKVANVDPEIVAGRYAQTSSPTGRPLLASVEHTKTNTAEGAGRMRLSVYPLADDDYKLRARYSITGEALTAANPYAYGGPAMAEVYKRACRAAAESEQDNLRPGEGTEWLHYQEALKSAILRDGRLQAKVLGKNTDKSDPSRLAGSGWWNTGMIGWVDPVTMEGVLPDDA